MSSRVRVPSWIMGFGYCSRVNKCWNRISTVWEVSTICFDTFLLLDGLSVSFFWKSLFLFAVRRLLYFLLRGCRKSRRSLFIFVCRDIFLKASYFKVPFFRFS